MLLAAGTDADVANAPGAKEILTVQLLRIKFHMEIRP